MGRIIGITIFFVLAIILAACSEKEVELTRIDIQGVNDKENYGDGVPIVDPEKLDLIKKSLENVKWEPNVQAEMARKEDVLVTLFYTIDKNMPERLYEYRIWFEDNETATLISNKESEGYGRLDRENTQNLKNALAD